MNLQSTAAAAYGLSSFFQQQADNIGGLQAQGQQLMQQPQTQGLLQAIMPALISALQQALQQFQGQAADGWGMPGASPGFDKQSLGGALANAFMQKLGQQLPELPGSPLQMPAEMRMPQLAAMPQAMPALPMPVLQPRQAAPTAAASSTPTGGNAAPMSFQAAASALGAEFDSVKDASGHITMDKLKQIAAQGPGNGISQAVFAAATHFVNNPQQFSTLENAFANANPSKPGATWNDGKASTTDFQAAGGMPAPMGTPTSVTPNTAGSDKAMDYGKAVKTLANGFDQVKNGDGHITMDRLKDIVKKGPGPNVSPEMHKAAEYFVNNRGAFERLETSNQSNAAGMPIIGDGKVSLKDIHQEIPKLKPGEGDAKVWNDLFSNSKGLFNGDKLCNKGELQKLADTGVLPDGSKASPEQQAAAKVFMSRPDMQILLDSAAHSNGSGDNTYSKKDMELVLKKAQGDRIR
jgi:hypothetical protein